MIPGRAVVAYGLVSLVVDSCHSTCQEDTAVNISAWSRPTPAD